MDETTRAQIVDALRSAAGALRRAELALVRAPSADPVSPAPGGPVLEGPERALFDFVKNEADRNKAFEESDPESFKLRLEAMNLDLLRFAVDRQTFVVGPKSAGAVSPEAVPAGNVFEKILKLLTAEGVNASEVLAPFVASPLVKNWSDVSPESDFTLVKYETEGPVPCLLDDQLGLLIQQAKLAPGAIERVVSALKDLQIEWTPFVDGKLVNVFAHHHIEAKWCAVVDCLAIASAVAQMMSLVEVSEVRDPVWWTAAAGSDSVPQPILEVIRGRKPSTVIKRAEADMINTWAAALPGWSDVSVPKTSPLSIRDLTVNDILV